MGKSVYNANDIYTPMLYAHNFITRQLEAELEEVKKKEKKIVNARLTGVLILHSR